MEHYKNLSLEDIDGEIWKDVVGYEGGYMVSNFGRVKSIERSVYHSPNKTLKVFEKIKKQLLNITNYPTVSLSNGRNRTHLVHRLLAMSFIPNPENKPQVNHIDFNPKNCIASNLEWATDSENKQHSKKFGRLKFVNGGEKAWNSKLTEVDVVEIRSRVANGEKVFEFNDEYGVTRCTIYSIIKNRTWRHI